MIELDTDRVSAVKQVIDYMYNGIIIYYFSLTMLRINLPTITDMLNQTNIYYPDKL